ncbi:MAG: agmatinase [Candidatus Izemoplasmataceae bacterium]
MNKVVTFIACDNLYEDAQTILFGAPFDGTVSYRPGTRFAPDIIRIDSENLEVYSPYLDKSLTDVQIADIGDVDIYFGAKERSLDSIYETTKKIISDDKRPFMIGGEHLVSLPAFKAVIEKHPDVHVIHIDAHTDLRDTFFGEKLSHATVLRRISDLTGPNKLYQFGIRSGMKEEFQFAQENHYIEPFTINTFSQKVKALKDKAIYLTLDLDALDPSIMMGTGTPEAGGLSYHELMHALYLLKDYNIVGCDVVELAPHYDPSGVSTATASKIIRELLLIITK